MENRYLGGPINVETLLQTKEAESSQLAEFADKKTVLLPTTLQELSPDALQKMLYSLQVHQIELQMQNEQLRTTQEQLDEASSRYFDLYDLAPVGYCTVNDKGHILEANLMAARLVGWNRNKLITQAITRFISKTDQDVYYMHRNLLIELAEPQTCELRMLNSNGVEFWAQLSTSIEQDIEGLPLIRMVMSDISERKNSEKILRDSEERYRNLFNSIDEGFCVIEMIYDGARPVDYRFLEVNPSFSKQCGLQNATGKRVLELVPNFDTSWFQIYGQVAATGEPIRFVREDKALHRWFEVYAFRIGERQNFKIAVLFNNITERKIIEAERLSFEQMLQANNINLEHAIAFAKKASAVAEKANLAKSDFLSSMSHELRTPLSAILGFAQLIEGSNPPPTPLQKRCVDQILQAGWYLLDLLNEILDLALVESGTLSVSLDCVSLAELLDECKAMVEMQAENRNIKLYFPQFEQACYVMADRTRLKQVLINLLTNAIKYNLHSGTVIVTISENMPGKLCVSVEDTGEGLTPEKITQLFQPFNRLGQETKVQEGTGIGLVLTKKLVELMGGEIGMRSVVGKGSVFWITINLAT